MTTDTTPKTGDNTIALVLAWAWVGIPIAWGVILTLGNAAKLFAH